MTETRMKPPPGCKSISQGRLRATIAEDGHIMVPDELFADAISHGFVVAHLPQGGAEQLDSSSSAAIQQQPAVPLAKPAMPGDGQSSAFDLPLSKDVPAPEPREAEGNGKRQK